MFIKVNYLHSIGNQQAGWVNKLEQTRHTTTKIGQNVDRKKKENTKKKKKKKRSFLQRQCAQELDRRKVNQSNQRLVSRE